MKNHLTLDRNTCATLCGVPNIGLTATDGAGILYLYDRSLKYFKTAQNRHNFCPQCLVVAALGTE